MPANEVNPSTGVETPGPARVNALRARGIKRVALYSLWLPTLLGVLELLASPGLQGLEYFFILLTWPAAIPLTVAISLLHRQTPFCAGVSATILSGATVSSYPESTEAMGRGVDTRDDGQGKANGASPIPIDGDEGGVR